MRVFYFGCNRRLILKNVDDEYFITIEEFEKTSLTMPAKRWKALFDLEKEIDENVHLLKNGRDVNFKEHFGGGFYVSVSTGYLCVDLRRHFHHPEKGIHPTKDGVALRLQEWARLKEIAQMIRAEIANVALCMDGNDHYNQLGFLTCYECSPFQLEIFTDLNVASS